MDITAHAGMDGTMPNSRENLLAALYSQADTIEIDVRCDKRGILYLHHDPLNSTVSEGEKDMLLTLDEAFDLVLRYADKKINCDLKEDGLEEAVHSLAVHYDMQHRLLYTGTVDFSAYEKPWQRDVQVYFNWERLQQYCQDFSGIAVESDLWNAAEELWRKKPKGLVGWNVEWHWFVKNRERFVVRQYPLSLWTVDGESALNTLLKEKDANIQSITTRNVRLAKQVKEKLLTATFDVETKKAVAVAGKGEN